MKLITWNVQWFCGLDDRVEVARIVRDARAMADFDVLCLQEVAIDYPGLTGDAGFDQVERLRGLLPGYEVLFGAAVQERGRHGRRQQFGNLIATRLPVLQAQSYPLPYPADGGVRTMPRICTTATLQTGLGPIRIMTSHLEFYSKAQRRVQAQALVDIHRQACAHALHPPLDDETGGPFQNKVHTTQAVLCGDFNFEISDAEYGLIQASPGSASASAAAADPDATQLLDAWPLVHGTRPHDPTFRLFDQRYGPVPICCDFVFVSSNLQAHVKALRADLQTRASDHQPLLLELG